jgi:hypothetical protein
MKTAVKTAGTYITFKLGTPDTNMLEYYRTVSPSHLQIKTNFSFSCKHKAGPLETGNERVNQLHRIFHHIHTTSHSFTTTQTAQKMKAFKLF